MRENSSYKIFHLTEFTANLVVTELWRPKKECYRLPALISIKKQWNYIIYPRSRNEICCLLLQESFHWIKLNYMCGFNKSNLAVKSISMRTSPPPPLVTITIKFYGECIMKSREECQCNSVNAKAIWEFNFSTSSQSQLLMYNRLESDQGPTQ